MWPRSEWVTDKPIVSHQLAEQGQAGQLLANVFSLSHVTVPEVFAIVNSSQFPFGFLCGECTWLFYSIRVDTRAQLFEGRSALNPRVKI